MAAAPPSPAHPLAAQLLVGPRFVHAPHLGARFLQAIAAAGSGLDHLVGELPLAFSDSRRDADKFTCGVVFTDRRILARTPEGSADLPYPVITDARGAGGVLIDDLHLTAWGRAYKLTAVPEMAATAGFLQALLRIHPGYRVAPPRPLVTPTPDDPTGGAAARHGIWSGDVRVLPLLGMAIEGHHKGWVSAEVGADLVARAMLFDRTLAHGRGAHEGWWTSPLGAPDLAHAFTRMLGQPAGSYHEGNTLVLDFRLGGGSNVAGAAASTAVGLLALGVLGVGWVSTPGRSLQGVRVKIAPGHASTGFALFDGHGPTPLSHEWQRTVGRLFDVLPRIEGRLLIQRAAFGWDAPPQQLDDTPTDALFRRVAEAIGELEIGIFFPRAGG